MSERAMSDLHERPRDPDAWAEFEAEVDARIAPFDGRTYASLSENDRTDMVAAVIAHLYELHMVVRTLALEPPPKRASTRKARNGATG